jgi:hypothetical protein
MPEESTTPDVALVRSVVDVYTSGDIHGMMSWMLRA